MVGVLVFNSDGLSKNLAKVHNFSGLLLSNRMKINKKRPGLAH